MIRFQFVDDHRTEYSVKRMCTVLRINRSSFYKWASIREKRGLKACSGAVIGAKIQTIFDDEGGLYGAKRIAASLKEDKDLTEPVNHKRVVRIMKAMNLKGFSKKRRCVTTKRAPGHRVMPDWSAATSRPLAPTTSMRAISRTCRVKAGRICIWPPPLMFTRVNLLALLWQII